jgi:ATP:ADP antiporter, AAA family
MFTDISKKEAKKFSLLSLLLLFIVGTYWLLRPLKDSIFFGTVGGLNIPLAKTLSVVTVMILVFLYSKLVDLVSKHRLFYVIGTFYFVVFLLISIFLSHPVHGLNPDLPIGPHRWIGWITYFSIESFGSIFVALFWSFAASITKPESAKKGFPLILAGAQIGSISGPALGFLSHSIGLQALGFIACATTICIMLIMKLFLVAIPEEDRQSSTKEEDAKPKTGFFEGIKLIATKPYIFGIFCIVSLFEIVVTIVDYQMKMQAKLLPEYASNESFNIFLSTFGVATNTLALIMALIGTTFFMKRFGLVFCLVAFPVTLATIISGLYISSITTISPYTLLWITFGVMIIAKGLSYALNNPSKEMMYIPTSKDVKFKSKGWIDMFGSRLAKGAGSQFNNLFKSSIHSLMTYGTLAALGLIGIWIVIAMYIGQTFNKLTREDRIVG